MKLFFLKRRLSESESWSATELVRRKNKPVEVGASEKTDIELERWRESWSVGELERQVCLQILFVGTTV